MSIIRFLSFILITIIASNAPVAAQVDWTEQRKEVQTFCKVPGEKIDHKGIILNPSPHVMTVDSAITIPLANGFNPKGLLSTEFAGDLSGVGIPLSGKGLTIKADYGEKAAEKAGVKAVKGAYRLTIGKKGVAITAFDKSGVFYALQTLRQLLDSPAAAGGTLPGIAIHDYPDLPHRGVVEGFYGTPWSHEVRLSLIDFYGRNKMNEYIYGPKDDPFHSTPNWRKPYPADQAANISELVEACHKNYVDFVWAVHPGKDIRWNKADYDSLVAKFNMMYDIGVRSFALFFDDIKGKGTDSKMQTKLVNDLTRDFVQAKGDVNRLMICPTDYTQLWANPSPDGQLAVYGETLTPDAEVFWTGAVVCSDLTPKTLEFVNSRIKRPALFWWNYPVSDYCRNFILQGPVYGLDTSLTAADLAGIESNPMEHGEASKLALYGVADYAWNIADYNPIDNWERGINHLVPEAPEAYRLFAIHSCDTQTGYRRDESWETQIFPFNRYTQAQFDALSEEFFKIKEVPALLHSMSNKQLLDELYPWITQFGKLGLRGLFTLNLIKIFESGDPARFWEAYVHNLMTPKEAADWQAHKIGTLKLQPFIENAMDSMLVAFYRSETGALPRIPRPIGSYKNLPTSQGKLMLDNDTTTFYHSGSSQKTDQWIGLDLGEITDVEHIEILQGRKDGDIDYYDRAILETSLDGTQWSPVSDEINGQYSIVWKGAPVKARYVRLRKLESKRNNWVAVRSFRVNPATPENIGVSIEANNADSAILAFDGNPSTEYVCTDFLRFSRKPEASSAILLLGPLSETVFVAQLSDDGTVLGTSFSRSPYIAIDFEPCTKTIEVTGPVSIFEIIQK